MAMRKASFLPGFVVILLIVSSTSAEVRVGLIETDLQLVAVCNAALTDGQCQPGSTVNTNLFNRSGCLADDVARGTVNAAELFFRQRIQVLIPGQCTQEALEIARLSYFWKVPVVNRAGRTPELFDNYYYPTLVQVPDVSVIAVTLALEQFLKTLNLNSLGMTEIVLLGPNTTSMGDKEYVTLAHGIQRYVKYFNTGIQLRVSGYVEIDEDNWVDVFDTVRKVRSPTKGKLAL
ncbi:Adenylate and Guanylate cyclase catalytic domain containing protein [Aphelenchoides avenae]|nr:Adenylate and Guanylate cyclase catalytic domain containing protein [Aphelenchus avenae]